MRREGRKKGEKRRVKLRKKRRKGIDVHTDHLIKSLWKSC